MEFRDLNTETTKAESTTVLGQLSYCVVQMLLESLRNTFLGERFLDCEIQMDTASQRRVSERVAANAKNRFAASLGASEQSETVYGDLVPARRRLYGFICYLKGALRSRSLEVPELPKEGSDRISSFAHVIVRLRAQLQQQEDGNRKPRLENPWRVEGVLTKLAMSFGSSLEKILS